MKQINGETAKNRRPMWHRALATVALAFISLSVAAAKAGTFTLEDAIAVAQRNSYDAQLARFSFVSSYWTYKSFRAELLPSVNLSGGLANFNHSRVEARNADDGRINYVSNNSLTNSLTLSVDQELPSLGGTLSLQSYLYRLDQFDYNMTTYNSQPLRLTYTQPLKAYNELKWRKKTAPKEYEMAKRVYLETVEGVAITATNLFFKAVSAQANYQQGVSKCQDLENLYAISQKRFALGTITKSDLLQLELSLLNTRVDMTNQKIAMDDALFNLFSYLRMTDYEGVQLASPDRVPDMTINVDDALQMALANSSHQPEQDVTMLTAQKNLAQAKSAKGLQVQLSGEVGFSRTTDSFSAAYRNLQDNEIVGVTLSMPIFDWGVQKGRVKVAQSNLELAKTKVEQAHVEYVQGLRRQVVQFSFQAEQCRTSMRAREISKERYDITKKRFEAGNITVTELNTAMQEQETAKTQFITQLQTYWTSYFSLRKATLYDWTNHRPLTADFAALADEP